MKIFISWSKSMSMELAVKIKELLESIDPDTKAFVSETDIAGGEDVQSKIIERINQCDKLVICFTKETKKSPWLLFEAGYARGRRKTVIPLLFDGDPNWHSWIDNPMNIAREIRFYGDNFVIDFMRAFGIENISKNRHKIERFQQEAIAVKERYRTVDMECEDLIERLVSDGTFYMENPYYRDKTAFFLTGFESFELYKIVTDSFQYTGKYLWIYGRKNMKLFSGNYGAFFRYLDEKAFNKSLGMDGIDFRCLFLDPNSDEVAHAHKQQEIFALELKSSILRAKSIVETSPGLKECFRCYANKREEIIIRLDNCIIYSRPFFDANGAPQLLTNTGFEVFGAKTARGQECIHKFENIWNNGKEMF